MCRLGGRTSPPMLVGFTTELRRAGITVGSGDVLTYCAAATVVDVTDLVDLYWAGRCTLVTRREQVPAYHRTFVSYFLGEPGLLARRRRPFAAMARAEALATLEIAETERRARSRRSSSRAGVRRGEGVDGQGQELRRLHARGAGRAPPHHAHHAAGAAATPYPAYGAHAARPAARPAAYRPRVDAAARRARRPPPAAPAAAHAPADAAARRLRLDGRLLAQPRAVRAHLDPRRRPGRGVLLRHPADPDHPRARAPTPRPRARPGRGRGHRLGGRDADRRLPGRVRTTLGAARADPRRDRGDLLRRSRPRRPRAARVRDAAAVAAVPPDRLAQPPQGRRARTSPPTPWA